LNSSSSRFEVPALELVVLAVDRVGDGVRDAVVLDVFRDVVNAVAAASGAPRAAPV
jgi:hypothetical protein